MVVKSIFWNAMKFTQNSNFKLVLSRKIKPSFEADSFNIQDQLFTVFESTENFKQDSGVKITETGIRCELVNFWNTETLN